MSLSSRRLPRELRGLPLTACLLLAGCAEPQVHPSPRLGAPMGPPAVPFVAPPPALPPPAAALVPSLATPPPPEPAPVPIPLPPNICSACRTALPRGRLQSSSIDEASGIAASAIHGGVYYVHNDSGDMPRFFAIDRSGADLGTFSVQPALALDWEDMARGPCGSGGSGGSDVRSCLYFGDIGDNLRIRPTGAIYRVAEPALLGPGEHNAQAESFPFRYPDGPCDAETLLVHPLTGAITIVSKVRSGTSSVYEFPRPLVVNQVVTLLKVGEIVPPEGSPRFTAGDVHPRGEGVLLRTYDRLWFYAMRPDQSVAQALVGVPCPVAVAKEQQGEAVAWEADGRGYVTTSEGLGAPIDAVSCWAR